MTKCTSLQYFFRRHDLYLIVVTFLFLSLIPFNPNYHHILDSVEEAARYSLHGGDCSDFKW